MPVIEIKSDKQQRKALDVLIEVGGPFQGRGPLERRTLVVTNAQYQALLHAGVVKPKARKVRSRAQKANFDGKVEGTAQPPSVPATRRPPANS